MPDANEEIIRQYLELQGFFVRTNIAYFRPMSETGKKSSGWGDLDVLALHPDGRRYLVEVKGWHTEDVTPSYFQRDNPYIDDLMKNEAARHFGTWDFRTVLVVPSIGVLSRKPVLALAKQEGIDDIWEFGDILQDMLINVNVAQNQRSEVLQMLRLFKAYELSRRDLQTRQVSLAGDQRGSPTKAKKRP